jgi:tRNA(Ile2) C34 agmatinyltransferase TiaS
MHYCNKEENQTSTIYETCKAELKHLLGEEGFDELEEYRKEHLHKIKTEKISE